MKTVNAKTKLTPAEVLSALPAMNMNLADDDDLIAGATKAIERNFKDANAALDFALAWRSGFRDGRASLGSAPAAIAQEPISELEHSSFDAEAIRKAERDRIEAITKDAPADKAQVALALALNSNMDAEEAIKVLKDMPIPHASLVNQVFSGIRASECAGGLAEYNPESRMATASISPVGFMPEDPLAKPDPAKIALKSAVAKANSQQSGKAR